MAAAILADMIREGFRISSFSTQRSKVEDLFLEIESTGTDTDNPG